MSEDDPPRREFPELESVEVKTEEGEQIERHYPEILEETPELLALLGDTEAKRVVDIHSELKELSGELEESIYLLEHTNCKLQHPDIKQKHQELKQRSEDLLERVEELRRGAENWKHAEESFSTAIQDELEDEKKSRQRWQIISLLLTILSLSLSTVTVFEISLPSLPLSFIFTAGVVSFLLLPG